MGIYLLSVISARWAVPVDKEPVVIWFNYRGELLTRLFGRWSCDSPRGSGSASVCSKHATLQCFKELYAQAKPTVGRPWSKKAKAEKKKTAFTKEASSGKQGRKRGRPKGTNVSTEVGKSQQTLSAFFSRSSSSSSSFYIRFRGPPCTLTFAWHHVPCTRA